MKLFGVFFFTLLFSSVSLAHSSCEATVSGPLLLKKTQEFFTASDFPEPFKKFVNSRVFERSSDSIEVVKMALWMQNMKSTRSFLVPHGDWFYIHPEAKMWSYNLKDAEGQTLARIYGNVEMRERDLYVVFDSIEIYEGGQSTLRDGQNTSSLNLAFTRIVAGITMGVEGLVKPYQDVDRLHLVTMGTVHARLARLWIDKWGWTKREHFDPIPVDDLTRTMTEDNRDATVELVAPQDQEIVTSL